MQEKIHYEKVMNTKVLPDIKAAEEQYRELEHNRKVHFRSCFKIYAFPECMFFLLL